MTALIKAGMAQDEVRPLPVGLAPHASSPADAAAPRRLPLELALDDAYEEIAALQRDMLTLQDDHRTALASARAAGERTGLARAQDDSDRLAELVADAAAAALLAWAQRLAALDALAATIARTALAKIFAPADDLAELAARAAARQVAALREASVVCVVVSAHDFAAPAARAALAARLGDAARDIRADPALASGECRIDLRLGQIDCGVAAQWAALDALLATLGTPDDAA